MIQASRQIEQWFSGRQDIWRRQGVDARLRLPQPALGDKAVLTFEQASHVCSVTVRPGRVEFILMRTDAPPALVSFDREFQDTAELEAILESFDRQLARVTAAGRPLRAFETHAGRPVRRVGRRPSRA